VYSIRGRKVIRAHERPTIGAWYWDKENKDQVFEIVAIDPIEELLEIQYFNGEVEEIDFDAWYESHPISIAPPKDWSGPFEVEKDVYTELDDKAQHLDTWNDPLNQIE
jgi:hypothetical protein